MAPLPIVAVGPTLYRSPQPQSEDDFREITALGIRRIIDLENERGEALWESTRCAIDGIRFVTVPISAYSPPGRKTLSMLLEDLSVVTTPTLLHCYFGQDRTGLVCGLWRVSQGWSKRRAWKEMRAQGFHPLLVGLTWAFWTY